MSDLLLGRLKETKFNNTIIAAESEKKKIYIYYHDRLSLGTALKVSAVLFFSTYVLSNIAFNSGM